MRKRDLILVTGIIMLGVVAGILLQNSIWQTIYIAMIFLIIGMLFLLISGVLVAVCWRNLRFRSWSRHLALIVPALILSVAMLVVTLCLINRWKIEAVEAYVMRAVPVLDRIKAQSGGILRGCQ
jgi:hypothetical protein